MLVIALISKWEICWALQSLIVFDLDYNPTQNNIVTVFNEKFSEAQGLIFVFEKENHTAALCIFS